MGDNDSVTVNGVFNEDNRGRDTVISGMEVAKTWKRCSTTETNGGEGIRMMEDYVMTTAEETWEDDNGCDRDTG